MIFQEWVREVCNGKPGEAARRIEAATGTPIGYARAHRWYNQFAPLPLNYARLVVQATEGVCTFDELIDKAIIGERFQWETDPNAERRFFKKKLSVLERELRELEAIERRGRTARDVAREVDEIRARLRLEPRDPAPTPARRGRARAHESSAGTVSAPRKRSRRRAAPAAAA